MLMASVLRFALLAVGVIVVVVDPFAVVALRPHDIADRVALLTVDRENPEKWCMGLLIAPDSLVTYADCVKKYGPGVSWAFFGKSRRDFYEDATDKQPRKRGMHPHDRNDTNPSLKSTNDDAMSDDVVGDTEDWVPIIQTTIHPDFSGATSNPSTNLAVVRIQYPRATSPLALVPHIGRNRSRAVDFNTSTSSNIIKSFQAFQVSNEFVRTSRTTKLRPLGDFRKVGWRVCRRARRFMTSSSTSAPRGEVCVVANAIEDRQSEDLSNAFVVLEDKLVGMSVPEPESDAHRFLFLSEEEAFITSATRKKDTWIPVNPMIVGGQDSKLQGYLAGLRMSKDGENFCLGSLVAPQYVLTAAHCVQGNEFTHVSVGSLFSSNVQDGEQIKVRRTIIHPDFDADTFRNDYALVELEYISIQSPIVLYNGPQLKSRTPLRMYGYGGPPQDGNPRSVQSVELPVVSKKTCMAKLQPPVLDATMLCAGGEAGKDACQGDSGGPLVLETNGKKSLVGLSSYGRGCGVQDMPAVYAVVAEARRFIDSHVDAPRWLESSSSPSSAVISPPAPAPGPTAKHDMSDHGSPALPQGREDDPVSPDTRSDPAISIIATQSNWTVVTHIPTDSKPGLVIAPPVSQWTRDVITNVLLASNFSPNVSLPAWYSCSGSLEFYSSVNLDPISSMVTRYEGNPLRRRARRFGAHPTDAPRSSSMCQGH